MINSDITNEECTCGHLRIVHQGEVHHGQCGVKGCLCNKFTWKSSEHNLEILDKVKKERPITMNGQTIWTTVY